MGDAVKCRSCDGLGKKWVNIAPRPGSIFGSTREYPCRACGGSGINDKLRSTRCERCRSEIIYPAHAQFEPKYCRSCKADVQREKAEAKAARDAKWREKSCSGCGTTFRYHVDSERIPDLCQTCREKKRQERAAREANMREKPCPGYNGYCGNTIRYDVTKVPNGYPLCRECSEKKREATRKLTKTCAGCGTTITYQANWKDVSDYCHECEKRRKQKQESNYSQNKRFYAAVKKMGLTKEQIYEFSDYLHSQPRFDVESMTYDEIKAAISDYFE